MWERRTVGKGGRRKEGGGFDIVKHTIVSVAIEIVMSAYVYHVLSMQYDRFVYFFGCTLYVDMMACSICRGAFAFEPPIPSVPFG